MAARNKRDAAVRAARANYQQELRAIQRLRNSLEGITPVRGAPAQGVGPKRKSVADLVRKILPPPGNQFTLVDIIQAVRLVDASRRYRRDSMRTLFAQLRNEGLIKRVQRLGKGQVIWESVEPPAPPVVPFEAMLLPDAITIILKERGPLRAPAITMALQDRGYRVDASVKALQDSVRQALKRCTERFKCEDGKLWGLNSR